MTGKTFTVSVLMTAFNREPFIAEAIQSVLKSTFTDFELIIVDDGSTDNTVNIARDFERKDQRIKVYVNDQNLGDYPNRNRAASYAKGKYLKYLDSDDYFYKEGLQYCVCLMEQNPEADWAIYNEDKGLEGKILQPSESMARHFFKKPFLNHGPGGMIIKRSFFNEIGCFPEKYGPANDMYFNLKAASKGNLLLMTKTFLFYRLHEGQEINNRFSYLYNNYNYLRDALEEIILPLDQEKIKWISRKNKRRFTVNFVKFVWATRNISKARFLLQQTGFGFRDALQGIFH